jgi:hypothetical protein
MIDPQTAGTHNNHDNNDDGNNAKCKAMSVTTLQEVCTTALMAMMMATTQVKEESK